MSVLVGWQQPTDKARILYNFDRKFRQPQKSPRFKSLKFKIKFIGHLGQQIFRIRELTVEMVQYTFARPAQNMLLYTVEQHKNTCDH